MAELFGHGALGQRVGEPFGINGRMAGVEDLGQFGEGPVHPVIGLGRIVVVDAQLAALVVSEGIDDPGHLDQMPFVMAGQPVELARHQQGLQA
jgi:hypothetical protein